MTAAQVKKLIPEKSFIKYGNYKYRVAGTMRMFGAWMIHIYDEPPSDHMDTLNAENCDFIESKKRAK